MPRIFGFKQFLRNITGGYSGMKEELTARGMGTNKSTEQLQEVMIEGGNAHCVYRIYYYGFG